MSQESSTGEMTEQGGPQSPQNPDRTRPYTESSVIMTTVRIISPFVFTYGLFIMFHGADSSGGGFQGGAVIASMVLMLAFAFGIEPTREWFKNVAVVGLTTGGVLAFVAIGLGPMLLEWAGFDVGGHGNFLDYRAYKEVLEFKKATKYGIEGVELGIGAIVAGAISGLFFAMARAFEFTEGVE